MNPAIRTSIHMFGEKLRRDFAGKYFFSITKIVADLEKPI